MRGMVVGEGGRSSGGSTVIVIIVSRRSCAIIKKNSTSIVLDYRQFEQIPNIHIVLYAPYLKYTCKIISKRNK